MKTKFSLTFTTVLMIASFALGQVWTASSWVTRVDMRLARIEEKIGIKPETIGKHELFPMAEAEENENFDRSRSIHKRR